MFVSTFFIAAAGTWVTERLVVPRLGEYRGDQLSEPLRPLERREKRGLLLAGLVVLALAIVALAGLIPEQGFLRQADTGSILRSPLLEGIVAVIFLLGALAGIVYGVAAGTLRSDTDVVKCMGKAMETMGTYMVLVFFAAQFVAYFERYEPRAGIGTVVATMLPYTVVFLIIWAALLAVWMLLGLPVGPGANLFLE